MNENTNIPEWAWAVYQAKQHEALQHPSDAIEEVLTYLVRLFGAGELPHTQARLEQMIDNHRAGERQKQRRRQRILGNFADSSVTIDSISSTRASSAERLEIIQRSVTATQWKLLTAVADGNSYQHLAGEGITPRGTIKSSVCRLRKKLRTLLGEKDSTSFVA